MFNPVLVEMNSILKSRPSQTGETPSKTSEREILQLLRNALSGTEAHTKLFLSKEEAELHQITQKLGDRSYGGMIQSAMYEEVRTEVKQRASAAVCKTR